MLREAGTDLDFLRAFKAGAKDLRSKVAQLFVVNDDEDSALAYVLTFACLMYRLTS
jgi:hypothetical protein